MSIKLSLIFSFFQITYAKIKKDSFRDKIMRDRLRRREPENEIEKRIKKLLLLIDSEG